VADRTLEQALSSLLNNAADASPGGFEIVGRTDDGNVVIDILDRGPGLTPEVQARAGELFFSTKAEEGMGIGLFLANATIERFGGSVRLFNRAGGGACTSVMLPSLAETPAAD
jgi:two-component system sensor histidine kinase RegB